MFIVNHSMEVAQNLLNLLKEDNILDTIKIEIESYQNGREQGYSLIFYLDHSKHDYYKYQISFSEDRISDEIVVYAGPASCQAISDEAYANARRFSVGDYDSAKNYIIELILGLDIEPEEEAM